MANFIPSKKIASEFNNGTQYLDGDAVQAKTVNDVIESQLWTQALATNAPDTTYIADEGAATVGISAMPDGTPRFVFKNLKGRKGDTGDSGIGSLSSGLFYIGVDNSTGDLYAEYLDGDTVPQFELDENGDLWYII